MKYIANAINIVQSSRDELFLEGIVCYGWNAVSNSELVQDMATDKKIRMIAKNRLNSN